MKETEPEFAGKIVYLTTGARGEGGEGLILDSPRFERQCGRMFLVGIIPEQTANWISGISAAIAWDAVSQYLVFDSMDDYLVRVAAHTEPLCGNT